MGEPEVEQTRSMDETEEPGKTAETDEGAEDEGAEQAQGEGDGA